MNRLSISVCFKMNAVKCLFALALAETMLLSISQHGVSVWRPRLGLPPRDPR